MKIIALMPMYKIMEAPAVQSLVAFQNDIFNQGDDLEIVFTNGFNTVQARTAMFKYAAQQECDYVISLDSDHIYKASAFYELIRRMKDQKLGSLSAAYYVRGMRKLAHGSFNPDGKFEKADHQKGVNWVDVVGLGFFVMTSLMIKKMVTTFGDDLFHMDYKNNTTEDVWFCRKMKEIGFPVAYDGDVVVGHLMTVINK